MTTPIPPQGYTEEHWCIFESATGKILATETIWTDEGFDGERGPSANLLEQFGTDRRGLAVEIDSIEVDHPPAAGGRVDIVRRAVVIESTPEIEEIVRPTTLEGP